MYVSTHASSQTDWTYATVTGNAHANGSSVTMTWSNAPESRRFRSAAEQRLDESPRAFEGDVGKLTALVRRKEATKKATADMASRARRRPPERARLLGAQLQTTRAAIAARRIAQSQNRGA